MFENNIVWTSLVGRFIKETNYSPVSINKEIEVGDVLQKDDKTNKVVNYGSINNIITSKEFKEWMERNETK